MLAEVCNKGWREFAADLLKATYYRALTTSLFASVGLLTPGNEEYWISLGVYFEGFAVRYEQCESCQSPPWI